MVKKNKAAAAAKPTKGKLPRPTPPRPAPLIRSVELKEIEAADDPSVAMSALTVDSSLRPPTTTTTNTTAEEDDPADSSPPDPLLPMASLKRRLLARKLSLQESEPDHIPPSTAEWLERIALSGADENKDYQDDEKGDNKNKGVVATAISAEKDVLDEERVKQPSNSWLEAIRSIRASSEGAIEQEEEQQQQHSANEKSTPTGRTGREDAANNTWLGFLRLYPNTPAASFQEYDDVDDKEDWQEGIAPPESCLGYFGVAEKGEETDSKQEPVGIDGLFTKYLSMAAATAAAAGISSGNSIGRSRTEEEESATESSSASESCNTAVSSNGGVHSLPGDQDANDAEDVKAIVSESKKEVGGIAEVTHSVPRQNSRQESEDQKVECTLSEGGPAKVDSTNSTDASSAKDSLSKDKAGKSETSRRCRRVLILAALIVCLVVAVFAATVGVSYSMYSSPFFSALQESSVASNMPSDMPSDQPSGDPSAAPTSAPSPSPSAAPSASPSARPSASPSAAPTEYVTRRVEFAAIGDAPYTRYQSEDLKDQMRFLDDSAEFVIHVGDIRSSSGGDDCSLRVYENAADILLRSPVPVFIILGDNDWLDCPDASEGVDNWRSVFHGFEDNWNHNFNVIRDPDHRHNFAFEHQHVLFLGLNIPGGRPSGRNFEAQLRENFSWAKSIIQSYDERMGDKTGRVVIFSHATPRSRHDTFFDKMAQLVEEDLNHQIPFLFINGDGHEWEYERYFHDQSSFLRIQMRGLVKEPPTMIRVTANGDSESVRTAFQYHRGSGDYE